MTETNITVGRVVHFTHGAETCAAIVTKVHKDGVNLTVFLPHGGVTGKMYVLASDDPKEGHWNWPPRV